MKYTSLSQHPRGDACHHKTKKKHKQKNIIKKIILVKKKVLLRTTSMRSKTRTKSKSRKPSPSRVPVRSRRKTNNALDRHIQLVSPATLLDALVSKSSQVSTRLHHHLLPLVTELREQLHQSSQQPATPELSVPKSSCLSSPLCLDRVLAVTEIIHGYAPESDTEYEAWQQLREVLHQFHDRVVELDTLSEPERQAIRLRLTQVSAKQALEIAENEAKNVKRQLHHEVQVHEQEEARFTRDLEALEAQYLQQKREREGAEQDMKTMQQHLAQQQQQSRDMVSQYAAYAKELNAELANAKTQLDEANGERKKLELVIDQLHASQKVLGEDLTRLNAEHEKELMELESGALNGNLINGLAEGSDGALIEQYQSRIAMLEEKLEEALHGLEQSHQVTKDSLKLRDREHDQPSSSLARELLTVTEQLQHEREEKAKVESELVQMRRNLAEAHMKMNEHADREVNEAHGRVSNLHQEMSYLTSKLSAKEKELGELRQRSQMTESNARQLAGQLQRELERTREALRLHQQQLQARDRQLREQGSRMQTEYTARARDMEAQLRQKGQQLQAAMQQERRRLNQEVETMKEQLQQRKSELDAARKQALEAKQSYDQRVLETNDQLKQASAMMTMHQAQQLDLKAQLSEMKTQRDTLLKVEEEHRRQLQALQLQVQRHSGQSSARVEELEASLAELKTVRSQAQQKLQQCSTSRASLLSKHQQLQQDYHALQQRLQESERFQAEMRDNYEKRLQRNEAERGQDATMLSECRVKLDEAARVHQSHQALLKNIDQERGQLAGMRDKMQEYAKGLTALQTRDETTQAENAELRHAIQQCSAASSELRREVKRRSEQIEAMEKHSHHLQRDLQQRALEFRDQLQSREHRLRSSNESQTQIEQDLREDNRRLEAMYKELQSELNLVRKQKDVSLRQQVEQEKKSAQQLALMLEAQELQEQRRRL